MPITVPLVVDAMFKSVKTAFVSALVAHAFAWLAGFYLAFVPFYQGVVVAPVIQLESIPPASGNEAAIPVLDDESGSGTKRFTATLIEINGLWVMWLLLVPVLLTGIVVLAVRRADISQMRRFLLLWGSTMLLLVLCAVSILSIGVLYLPAALALVFTAFTYPRGRSVALGAI